MSDDEIEGARRFTERCLRLERDALFPELIAALDDLVHEYISLSIETKQSLSYRTNLALIAAGAALARVKESGL
jgi:hypothetical protein